MKQRAITSVIILAILIPLLLLSEYIVYPICLSAICVMAVYEMLRVLGMDKKWIISIPAYVIAAAMPVFTHTLFLQDEMQKQIGYLLIVAAVMFVYLLYTMGVAVFSKGKIGVSDIGSAFLTVTYIVVSFTAFSMIRYIENGDLCFILVFAAAWVSDSCAFFAGYFFGKHKLIPEVSPKKTVEGAIGGVVCASIGFMLYGLVIDLFTSVEVNYLVLAIAGLVLSVVSQIGDLIASMIKREHGVKDYGNLLPGHGGIMDRFDSIMAVSAPLLAICIIFPPFS